MQLIDQINLVYGSEGRRIELYQGDLVALSPDEVVDILIVSAFPNDYFPLRGTLIGALRENGVSVGELARHKCVDLREQFGCWLSEEIRGQHFRRILCFEPRRRGSPPDVVGDIFESLMPFLLGENANAVVAMPVVAAGNQGTAPEEMLPALLEAATQWISKGLALRTLKIVERSPAKAKTLRKMFGEFKRTFTSPPSRRPTAFQYDAFVSYAHKDSSEVNLLVRELQTERRGIRLFVDRLSLRQGAAWHPEIYEALDACNRVIVVLSPDYLASKQCKFEFNVALLRQNEGDADILLPIYLQTTNLPTYMRILQHIDCRERDASKLKIASREMLASI